MPKRSPSPESEDRSPKRGRRENDDGRDADDDRDKRNQRDSSDSRDNRNRRDRDAQREQRSDRRDRRRDSRSESEENVRRGRDDRDRYRSDRDRYTSRHNSDEERDGRRSRYSQRGRDSRRRDEPDVRRSRGSDRDERRHERDDDRGERRRGDDRGRREDKEEGKQPAANGAELATAAAEPRQRKEVAAGPAGGVYIPPFKLAAMLAEVEDRESAAYQRLTWDALRKSINGLINKVNVVNIKNILPEFFNENLIRGRGLFCRSLMKSQIASPTFTPIYAALVAVINTKLPEIGELLLHRVVTQFKRAFKRNDKPICMAALTLIGHLTNQQVVAEGLALEIMLLLLENPSDDSVEVASQFLQEVGALLEDIAPQGLQAIFDRLRSILAEAQVPPRTGYIIQNVMMARKGKFALTHPVIPDGLDLVETSDQITHEVSLDDPLDTKMYLDVFKEDPEFAAHEAEYAAIRREILGEEEEESEEEEEEGGGEGSESEEENEEEEEGAPAGQGGISDLTSTNLVNLRRTIYLTIMSALDFEEAGHKLLKMGIPEGHEMELCTMIIECCSNEKTFVKYYGLLAERFSKLNRKYSELFCDCFVRQYQLIHRLETNKLRNVAKLFGHLLASDAIPWSVLSVIRLTEEDTTSSSRIFIKILFQELAESLGLLSLNERLGDPDCQEWYEGVFPRDSPRHMRFAINFFTSIGLGGLTDRMRDMLKELQQLAAQQAAAQAAAESESESDASSSSSSDSDSSSDTESDSDTSSSGGSDSDTSSGSDSESEEEEEQDRRGSKGGSKQRGGSRAQPPEGRQSSRPAHANGGKPVEGVRQREGNSGGERDYERERATGRGEEEGRGQRRRGDERDNRGRGSLRGEEQGDGRERRSGSGRGYNDRPERGREERRERGDDRGDRRR